MDTPEEVHIKTSLRDGSAMLLVFSDEFNTDGRTFYPGDDPYWEAEDLHYWVRCTAHCTIRFFTGLPRLQII